MFSGLEARFCQRVMGRRRRGDDHGLGFGIVDSLFPRCCSFGLWIIAFHIGTPLRVLFGDPSNEAARLRRKVSYQIWAPITTTELRHTDFIVAHTYLPLGPDN